MKTYLMTLFASCTGLRVGRLPAQRIRLLVVLAAILIVGFFLTAQRCYASNFGSLSTMGGWNGITGITGFGLSGNPGNGDGTVGQTFRINDASVFIRTISFPIWADTATAKFQVGVAAWSGTQPTGSLLYLSDPLVAAGSGWQTFTVMPNNNVELDQGSEYVLFFTPNAFVGTSPGYNTAVGGVPSAYYTDGQFCSLAGYRLSISDLFVNSWSTAPANLAFSINYRIAPAPEPTSLTIVAAVGCAFIGRYFCRRKH